jgi:outer membrane protein assembly factor BamA
VEYSLIRFFRIGLFFLALYGTWSSHAQRRFPIIYEDGKPIGKPGRGLPGSIKLDEDSILRLNQLLDFRQVLFERSFLGAEVRFAKDTVKVLKGPAVTWGKAKPCDTLSQKLLILAGGFQELGGRPITGSSLTNLFDKTLKYYENHGYPFTRIEFRNSKIDSSGVFDACIYVDRGPYISIDSVEIKGKLKISRNYFLTYTGIRPGRPYQENAVLQAIRRSRALPWASEAQPPRLIFVDQSARLRFFLEPQKANVFDGFLGFLPDDRTAKLNITGQMRIRLQNALSRGESVEVDWRRLQLNSRDLKARAYFPCLLRTPFGPEYQIRLFQRDTVFIDVNQEFAVSYTLSGNNAIRLFYKVRNSSLVSSKGYANVTTLPDYADVRIGSYGLGLRLEESDDRFNPRKGYFVNAAAWAGNKEIRINPAVNPEAYTGVKLKSAQITAEASADLFFPLAGRFVLVQGFRGGMFSGEKLLLNESFRLGGLRSLRGFDEESIFASSYGTGNIEIRFLPDRATNIFAFFNGGWYENNNVNSYSNDWPYGFGTGIQFLTKAGQFAFTYALGGQEGFTPSFRTAKIHFGITSSF